MDRKNNGGEGYNPDKELDELFKRYKIDDGIPKKRNEASKRIDEKGISMNSRVPSSDHYKNISRDRYKNIESVHQNKSNNQRPINPQNKNLAKKKSIPQNKTSHKYQTKNASQQKPLNHAKPKQDIMSKSEYIERPPRHSAENDINARKNSNKNPNYNGRPIHNGNSKQNANREKMIKRRKFKHKMREFKNFMYALLCFIGTKITSLFTKKKKTQEFINDEIAPRYKGEVYFNNHNPQNREVYEPIKNEKTNSHHKNKKEKNSSRLTISKILKKPKGRKRTKNEKKVFWGYISIMVVATIILTSWTMSCLNDAFAFNKDDEVVKVVIPKDVKRNDIVKILKKNKLISHKGFCKMVLSLTSDLDKNQENFLPGVYYVRKDIGVENMVKSFKPQNLTQTITVSIPEGWTIDQIAEQLEKSKVCSKKAFYDNLEQDIYDYNFAKSAQKKSGRYQNLEGYLFPDTYQFYIGDNPSRVIKKMLGQFDKKWTSEFAQKAKANNMTVDEVITLASMIQKEAGNEQQMKLISSVFHNRLERPTAFPTLQSDATADYVTNYVKGNINPSDYDSYLKKYNTYNCTGLPVGAICNPGETAIRAALEPDSTSYLYFCHNKETKELYVAKTLEKHNQNLKTAGLR